MGGKRSARRGREAGRGPDGKAGGQRDEAGGSSEEGREQRQVPAAALAVAVFAIGISAILIRLSEAEPVSIAFHRLLFTSAMVAPVALWKCRGELGRLDVADTAVMVGVGLVLAMHFATWITSLTMTTVAASNILVTAHPIFVGAAAHLFLGERLTKVNVVGIAVAYAGVIVLFSGSGDVAGGTLLGNFLAVVGGVLAGTYLMAGRKMRQRLSVWTYATVVYVSCTVFLLAFALVLGTPLGPYPAREYGLFVAMAVGPGILGHTLYNWSLGFLGARTVSLAHLGEPLIATAIAVPVLGETPGPYTILGGAIILAGVYLALERRARAARQKKGGGMELGKEEGVARAGKKSGTKE